MAEDEGHSRTRTAAGEGAGAGFPAGEWRIHRFDVLPSTNDLALEWIRAGRAGAGEVLVAERQPAGRGRRGREWESERGALLCTALLPFVPARVGWTALAAGLAAAEAVRGLGADAAVKWPNDVLLGGRKLGGVLVECAGADLCAVGVGINVQNPLSGPAAERGVRLADHVPDARPDELLRELLARLGERWVLLLEGRIPELQQAWDALDAAAGRRVRWVEQGVAGIALGVDASGALRIRCDTGAVQVAVAGDVLFE